MASAENLTVSLTVENLSGLSKEIRALVVVAMAARRLVKAPGWHQIGIEADEALMNLQAAVAALETAIDPKRE